MKLLHQRNEAVHIGTVLIDVGYSNIFVRDPELHIVGRKELIVSHIVGLDPHEGRGVVCLGVTVPILSADFDLLHIFPKLCAVLPELLVLSLDSALMMPFAMNKL